jgi:hypothetical protein
MLRSALLTLSLVLVHIVNAQTASPPAASGSSQPLIILISSSGLIGSRFEYERTGISECLSVMETSNEQRTNRPKEL